MEYLKNSKFAEYYRILLRGIKGLKLMYFSSNRYRFGFCAENAWIGIPCYGNKSRLFVHDGTGVGPNFMLLSSKGKCIVKEHVSIGPNVTVITDNHQNWNKIGSYPGGPDWGEYTDSGDVVISEHTWIGANVTICPGVVVPRGCVVAAGSVVVKGQYLPYSVLGGVTCRVIGWRFVGKDIIEHEKLLFPESERLSKECLNRIFEEQAKSL